MIRNEEREFGTLEFDIIVNGKYQERVKGGLLAYFNGNSDTLKVMCQGADVKLMTHIVVALIKWMIEHGCGNYLVDIMTELDKEFS